MSNDADRAGFDRIALELKRSAKPALLFLLLIVGGIATAAYVVKNLAGDKPWVDYVQYKVRFDNVEGVVPGRHELRIAGVKAGSIKGSELVDGKPVLILNVEKKYAPLRRDAKVSIRPVTALEDMYVDITSRGTEGTPELAPDEVLPVSRTKDMVEVGRVLNVLDDDTRPRLASLINELGKGTEDNGDQLRRTFASLGPFLETAADLGEVLDARRANTRRLVTNFANIAQTLSTRDRQLRGFVAQGQKTLGTLAEHGSTLDATLARLPGTLQTASTTFRNLRTTQTKLDAAVKSLVPVADALPKGLEDLGSLATAAIPAVSALRPAVRSLKPLAVQLPGNTSTADKTLGLLNPQLPQVAKGVKLATPCLPVAGTFLSRLISMTKWAESESLVANARATAIVDLSSASVLLKDFDWRIVPACFTDPEGAVKGNGVGSRPLPTKPDQKKEGDQ
ncbi:MAG: MlaD family protein [Solirubrobacteraceae bacterium]|nr:MlaD family protein [Solirubrobacteraceae bacterium]